MHQEWVKDGGVRRNAPDLQVHPYEEWIIRSRRMASQGLSPERYYTPDELRGLNQDQMSNYVARWQELCDLAVRERQRQRGYDPTELKPGGPTPNQQEVEEWIAMRKGRAGRPQPRSFNQTRAAGSVPNRHAVGDPRSGFYNAGEHLGQGLQNGAHASTANGAHQRGDNRNDFITPPKGNQAIPIQPPRPIAPSGNVQTSGEPAKDAKTPEPDVSFSYLLFLLLLISFVTLPILE